MKDDLTPRDIVHAEAFIRMVGEENLPRAVAALLKSERDLVKLFEKATGTTPTKWRLKNSEVTP